MDGWIHSFKMASVFSVVIYAFFHPVHPAVKWACDVEFEHNQLRKAILSLDHQLRMAEVLCVSPWGCAEWRPSWPLKSTKRAAVPGTIEAVILPSLITVNNIRVIPS